jgi:hypothetical protein
VILLSDSAEVLRSLGSSRFWWATLGLQHCETACFSGKILLIFLGKTCHALALAKLHLL